MRMISKSTDYAFKPYDIGRWLIWGLFALFLIFLPIIFNKNSSVILLSAIGTIAIFSLSYNILLGQGGMLSFGHAVYSGLGAFIAIHALNAVAKGSFYIPVSLIPLVGGLGGMFFAALFGYVSTRKSGTTFAMITLGVVELVAAMSLMFSEFFGGEAGISTNRVVGDSFFGLTYGPPIQVYYLVAIYTFICTALMFAFTRTPLGRILNAVRDNPERVEFVGYNTHLVRYFSFIIAGFFAGISGGVGVLNFEIVTSENVGPVRSGFVLLFTIIGGSPFFFGPIIGATVGSLVFFLFSEITKAWLLYLGSLFLVMVIYAPGGFSSLIMMNLRLAAYGRLRQIYCAYIALAVTGGSALFGASVLIEMLYHIQLEGGFGSVIRFAGFSLATDSPNTWFGAVFILLTGGGLFELTRRQFLIDWGEAQEHVEKEIKRRESL
jgi:branched-chain amino acid transport system permease protein